MTEEHQDRRIGDRDAITRDAMIHTKLDAMEKDHGSLVAQVSQLDNGINIVKLEQAHLKELVDVRFKGLELTQQVQLTETRQIAASLLAMGNEVEKTPLGRTLNGAIIEGRKDLDIHAIKMADLERWQERVNGVLLVLQWLGAAGVLALIIQVIRMISSGKFTP